MKLICNEHVLFHQTTEHSWALGNLYHIYPTQNDLSMETSKRSIVKRKIFRQDVHTETMEYFVPWVDAIGEEFQHKWIVLDVVVVRCCVVRLSLCKYQVTRYLLRSSDGHSVHYNGNPACNGPGWNAHMISWFQSNAARSTTIYYHFSFQSLRYRSTVIIVTLKHHQFRLQFISLFFLWSVQQDFITLKILHSHSFFQILLQHLLSCLCLISPVEINWIHYKRRLSYEYQQNIDNLFRRCTYSSW